MNWWCGSFAEVQNAIIHETKRLGNAVRAGSGVEWKSCGTSGCKKSICLDDFGGEYECKLSRMHSMPLTSVSSTAVSGAEALSSVSISNVAMETRLRFFTE